MTFFAKLARFCHIFSLFTLSLTPLIAIENSKKRVACDI